MKWKGIEGGYRRDKGEYWERRSQKQAAGIENTDARKDVVVRKHRRAKMLEQCDVRIWHPPVLLNK